MSERLVAMAARQKSQILSYDKITPENAAIILEALTQIAASALALPCACPVIAACYIAF